MMGEEKLVTVVVPAYNVEPYLKQCLDSLVNQTVSDHMVIIVNDGSTDGTESIAQKYAEEYPQMIRYIKQGNQGLGAARNTGLKYVTTPYVTFLDSDDWWDILLIEKLHTELKYHDEMPDMIFTLPWIYNSATGRVEEWHDKRRYEGLFYPYGGAEDVPSVPNNILRDRGLYELEVSSCRKIYRTDFLRECNFSFQVGVKWEDVKPHFELLHRANCCIAIKGTGFFYRINTGGQITSGGGASRLDLVPVFRETLAMAKQQEWDDKEVAYIIRMLWSFTTWSIDVTNSDYIGQLLDALHEFFLEIPMHNFKVYFNLCSPHRLREKVKTYLLRSPFYKLLKDYRVRRRAMRLAERIVRKR